MQYIRTLAAAAALFAASPAWATTLTFPVDGDTFSANGTVSTLGAGAYPYYTAPMWTLGDYITQTFISTGLATVNSLDFSYSIRDSLIGNATVGLFVNGIEVTTTYLTGNGDPTEVPASGDVTFAPITGDGTYVIRLQLVTAPAAGSLNFYPGGSITLADASLPEPASLSLLGAGLLGVSLPRRRRDPG